MRKSLWKLAAGLALLGLMAGACSGGGDDGAEEITTIKLIANPWNGSAANIEVAKQLLENELGYTVEVTDLDENAQWSSINTGELHASLEVWPSGHADNRADFIDNPEGNVRGRGPAGPDRQDRLVDARLHDRAAPRAGHRGGLPGCRVGRFVRHGRDGRPRADPARRPRAG